MLNDDPEDVIKKKGPGREVFEKLYSKSADPWFGNVSNAEAVRMALTEAFVKKYVSDSDTGLDFGCGNEQLTKRLPGFVTGVDIAFHNDIAISKAFATTYSYVCSFNVLSYYELKEWKGMLWNFYECLMGKGYCFVSIVVKGDLSINLSTFREEFKKLFELVEERVVTIDWHEDFRYRESPQYINDLENDTGEPTQVLLIGRKQ